ncbi:hypothetical protein [Listeria valentina]|nr:hypothetical protein [Listeria valentina]
MTDKKRSPQKEIIYQFQKIRLKQKALHHVQEGKPGRRYSTSHAINGKS